MSLIGRSQCFQLQGAGPPGGSWNSRLTQQVWQPCRRLSSYCCKPHTKQREKDRDLSPHLTLTFSTLPPYWLHWKPGGKESWEILLPELYYREE